MNLVHSNFLNTSIMCVLRTNLWRYEIVWILFSIARIFSIIYERMQFLNAFQILNLNRDIIAIATILYFTSSLRRIIVKASAKTLIHTSCDMTLRKFILRNCSSTIGSSNQFAFPRKIIIGEKIKALDSLLD